MSLGSATDVYGREMQILFGILDAEIDKHVFQPGGIPCVDERGASIRKQLQRKIRDWPGICFFCKAKKECDICALCECFRLLYATIR